MTGKWLVGVGVWYQNLVPGKFWYFPKMRKYISLTPNSISQRTLLWRHVIRGSNCDLLNFLLFWRVGINAGQGLIVVSNIQLVLFFWFLCYFSEIHYFLGRKWTEAHPEFRSFKFWWASAINKNEMGTWHHFRNLCGDFCVVGAILKEYRYPDISWYFFQGEYR